MSLPLNQLYYGDNLDVLEQHVKTESVDLIYLDPPFNSKRTYNVLFKPRSGDEPTAQIEAFDDTWTWDQGSESTYQNLVGGGAPNQVADTIQAMRGLLGDNDMLAYLVMMTPRLLQLHRVLKSTGSIYLHCDPTASHYLKLIMDAVFGAKQFENEIIWSYRSGGASPKRFAKKHDVLLSYSKSTSRYFDAQHEVSYNRGFKPYRFKGVKEFCDESGRWYTMPYMRDVWEIDMIGRTSPERLGYPTQKPIALLDRVIRSSCPPDGVVLDPFCGCGTAVDAAQSLGRRWIGIDITYLAIDLIDKRLRDRYGDSVASSYEIHGIPRDLAGAHALFAHNHFDFERWAVSLVHGQPNQKQVGDKGSDGIIRIPTDAHAKNIERVIVSVKGGKQLNPGMVRDLIGTVKNQRAAMGLLITMGAPTKGMREAAQHSGSWTYPVNGMQFPKVQIISIDELLRGKNPKLPPSIRPYIEASKLTAADQQIAMIPK